ncbi:MAG: DUF5715 family protein [Gemmatimonadetes bacterium]|nr:DUF5715 family protein [Gemmatimonadota bacterium]
MTRTPETQVSGASGRLVVPLLLLFTLTLPGALGAQSLRGSQRSLDRQNAMARANDFTFIRSAARVRTFVKNGWLVRVRPNRDVTLHGVSFPYARPEVAVFITRLAAEYHAACGEQLVVTSLTRPTSRQPRNASSRSVHPTGMAADIRYSPSRTCRGWLERVLLSLEKSGVIEATREHYPAHYHVAVFPTRYAAYVASLEAQRSRATTRLAKVPYKVRSGDSLWTIARAHGTTVDAIQEINDLDSSRIFAGQVIEVPTSR